MNPTRWPNLQATGALPAWLPFVAGALLVAVLLVVATFLPPETGREFFYTLLFAPILWSTAQLGYRVGLLVALALGVIYIVLFLPTEAQHGHFQIGAYILHAALRLGLFVAASWMFSRYYALEHRRLIALDEANTGVIKALAKALDMKDRYTLDHSSATVDHCVRLGKRLGLAEKDISSLAVAALLHDVGKVGILDNILRKPGRLTSDEREIMQRHPLLSAAILKESPALQAAVPLVLHHHERWDGKGYPHGMSGEKIPLGSRILAVVDAFHAMTSDRPYRKAMNLFGAMQELVMGAGKQFDPKVVLCFAQEMAERERLDIYDLLLPLPEAGEPGGVVGQQTA